MRIALCEDNAGDLELLRNHIGNYFFRMGYTGEIFTFSDGESLISAFSPGFFDIVFLDIMLPGISGVQVARKIRESDRNCLLLFITVSLDHAMDGFETQASAYVVKPLSREKVDKALYMCREVLNRNSRTIDIPSGREGRIALPLVNIQYIEVYGKSSIFHLHGGEIEARLSLDEIEDKLGEGPFLRCHRSYIVNMNHVEELGSDGFVMRSGKFVPMRKNGRKQVKIAFADFMAGRSSREVFG